MVESGDTLAKSVVILGIERKGKKGSTGQRRIIDMAETAYCMKCRKKVTIKNPQQVTLANGRSAIQGMCPVCGTKVFKFVGKA